MIQRGRSTFADRCKALALWSRAHPWLMLFCAVVGLYYLWTARSSGSAGGVPGPGYYNLLTDAFVHGHLHLLVEPSPDLLAQPDPYDPQAYALLGLPDLSLYHGHYYLYWGPAPAVVLFMPLRALGIDISQSTAVALFAFVGFCFSIAVLRELVARFTPDAPRWMVSAATLALALGNALPFTLRRPDVYEVAITAGYCFGFIAAYLAITALRDGVNRRRLAAASLFMGLALGSRPTMVVPALALVALAFWLWRRRSDRADGARILAAALGPLAAIVGLLAAYNAARFGSITEFGRTYQLVTVQSTDKAENQLRYGPPGIWYYLFSPPELTPRFPFIQLAPAGGSYPFRVPRVYTGVEHVAGLLVTVPFTLLAFAGLIVTRGKQRLVVAGLCAIAATMLFLASIAFWGATMRYEVDFASVFLIAAAIGWIVWAQAAGPRARTAIAAGGVCLIAWGTVFGAASGMTGYGDSLRVASPRTYDRFQRYTAIVPTLASRLAGKPLVLSATGSRGGISDSDAGAGVGTLAFALPYGATTDLTVASGSERRFGLVFTGTPGPGSTGRPRIDIRVPQTGDIHAIERRSFPLTVVPLRLKRGLNHIVISAAGAPGTTTQLAGVRLASLPRQ